MSRIILLLFLLAVRVTHAEEECRSNECPVQVNTLLQSSRSVQSQQQPAVTAQCDDTCYTKKGNLNPSKQCGKNKCKGCCECTGGECIDKTGLEEDENGREVTDETQRTYECADWCYSKKHQSKPWQEQKCGWYGCSVCPECAPACIETTYEGTFDYGPYANNGAMRVTINADCTAKWCRDFNIHPTASARGMKCDPTYPTSVLSGGVFKAGGDEGMYYWLSGTVSGSSINGSLVYKNYAAITHSCCTTGTNKNVFTLQQACTEKTYTGTFNYGPYANNGAMTVTINADCSAKWCRDFNTHPTASARGMKCDPTYPTSVLSGGIFKAGGDDGMYYWLSGTVAGSSIYGSLVYKNYAAITHSCCTTGTSKNEFTLQAPPTWSHIGVAKKYCPNSNGAQGSDQMSLQACKDKCAGLPASECAAIMYGSSCTGVTCGTRRGPQCKGADTCHCIICLDTEISDTTNPWDVYAIERQFEA